MKKKILSFYLLTLSFFVFAFDRPIVKNISAIPGKINTITITWTLPTNPKPEISTLKVYRTLKRITDFKELENEVPVATVEADSNGYTDQVPNYKEYFYTVLAKCGSKIQTEIISSQNSTVNGVHLTIPEPKQQKDTSNSDKNKTYEDGSLREKPLPFLDIIQNQKAEKIQLSVQAESVAKTLGKDSKESLKNSFLKPYIFEIDLISPEAGDDFLLFEILRKYFIQQKYSESQKELSKLLGTNISQDVLNRAVFYLGQSYYFQGKYQNAVKSFLKVYEIYPELSKKWVTCSLDLLEIPEF